MSENNQQLDPLYQIFASYRERDGVLSIEEAKEVLARPVMLQTKTTRTLKPIAIMSTIFAAAVSIVLLRLFSGTPDVPVQNQKIGIESKTSQTITTPSSISDGGQVGLSGLRGQPKVYKAFHRSEAVMPVPIVSLDSLGVVEVPESILAQLGIEPNGPGSVTIYAQQGGKNAFKITIEPHAIDLKEMKPSDVPATLIASRFSPIFVTSGAGQQRMYHCSPDSSSGHLGFRISTYDDAEAESYRNAVENSPKIPGLSFMGYNTTSMTDDNGHRTDTITVTLGNDIPALPSSPTPLTEYSEGVQQTAQRMADYLMGKGTMPSLKDLPQYLTLKADTMTCARILDQFDKVEHTDYIQKAHEALKNLNKLVPVAIRTTGARAPLTNSDYIFWYEPTEQFLSAMPEDVRARISSRIGSTNATMYGSQLIQSVMATAPTQDTIRVDYTVSKATTLGVGISDLTGRLLWHKQYDVESGSGTLQLHLGWQIEPGIYLLTTTTPSGERHSSRLFVDGPVQNNATPVTNTDNGSIPEAAAAVHFVELSNSQLAKLGLEDSRTTKVDGVTLYTMSGKELDVMTVLRDWGVMMPPSDHIALPSGVKPAKKTPAIITDGLGKKRMITMETTDGKSPQTEKEVSDQISNMIPILIRDKNDGSPLGTRDLVLWYFPTPELLAMLPAETQQPTAQVTATNEKTKDVASVSTPSHSAIAGASVFPNPSHGNISVHVNLLADRTLSVRLLDLSGKELVRKSGLGITPKGGADLRLDASAFGEGVYILDVTSDVGEHFFSKVVIIR